MSRFGWATGMCGGAPLLDDPSGPVQGRALGKARETLARGSASGRRPEAHLDKPDALRGGPICPRGALARLRR